MTKKDFWKSAMIWGAVCGLALFAISILSWALKLDENKMGMIAELLRFGVIFTVIFYTGRRNAALSGAEGYPYGRAVGYVFALMLFAGIVAGVGEFLMANFIARDYYDALYATQISAMVAVNPAIAQMSDQIIRMLANPFVLILGSVFNYVIKGGVLGLIFAAVVKKNPGVFISDPDDAPEQTNE